MSREGSLHAGLGVAARNEARRVLNRALDAAIEERVRLHGERREKKISVEEYKAGLSAVRHVEDTLEPIRKELGAERARRFELTHDPVRGAPMRAGRERLARSGRTMPAKPLEGA